MVMEWLPHLIVVILVFASLQLVKYVVDRNPAQFTKYQFELIAIATGVFLVVTHSLTGALIAAGVNILWSGSMLLLERLYKSDKANEQ